MKDPCATVRYNGCVKCHIAMEQGVDGCRTPDDKILLPLCARRALRRVAKLEGLIVDWHTCNDDGDDGDGYPTVQRLIAESVRIQARAK